MKWTYSTVPQDRADLDEKELEYTTARRPKDVRRTSSVIALSLALAASLSANAFFVSSQFFHPWQLYDQLPSRFAQLSRNVPTERLDNFAEFDSLNRTTQDTAWNDHDLEPWNGFLALDEDYALSQGLLHAQRWPWDDSKGVYITVNAHELHCVRMLRTSINEDQDNMPHDERTWSYPHVLHCLNVLRESIMCNADDTPMYVGRLHKNKFIEHPRAGTGEVKMCRDWQALLSWSQSHSACYRPVTWADGARNETDRYKYCPDGARPWEDL